MYISGTLRCVYLNAHAYKRIWYTAVLRKAAVPTKIGAIAMERFHVAQLVGLFLPIFFLKLFALISAQPTFADMGGRQTAQTVHYANTWAVEVRGGAEAADALALKHGLINRGKVQHSLRAIKFSLLLSLPFLISDWESTALLPLYARRGSESGNQGPERPHGHKNRGAERGRIGMTILYSLGFRALL